MVKIITPKTALKLDEDKLREEEALDGYYAILTSEYKESADRIIEIYIPAHFLTCFIALVIARILEMKLEHKYSIGQILKSLSKADCTHMKQNYYLFDYYDNVLKDMDNIFDIDFSTRIRSLGEIKKILANTKKDENTL